MHVDDLLITVVNSLPTVTYYTSSCGNSAISNHDVAGSIIVKHTKSILLLSLAFTVEGPIRSTHTCFQGCVVAFLGGICPYFNLCFLPLWHLSQNLTCLELYSLIFFSVHNSCQSFYRSDFPRMHQIVVIPLSHLILHTGCRNN